MKLKKSKKSKKSRHSSGDEDESQRYEKEDAVVAEIETEAPDSDERVEEEPVKKLKKYVAQEVDISKVCWFAI